MKAKYSRRKFIKTLGMLYGSVLLAPSCTSSPAGYRILSQEEANCLIALCEQIIPADEDPGATDAGVIYFIDKQAALRFPADLDVYHSGVTSLQQICKDRYGKQFEHLVTSVQVELMKDMEKGKLPETYWRKEHQTRFFNLVLSRTMQGFYGSPRHGGNKDYVSYRMLKLDYPLLIGQNRYRNEK